MDDPTEDDIRSRAFALSQDPDRAHLSDLDHWLDAERLVLGGLCEDEAAYAAKAASDPAAATGAGEGRPAS